MSREQSTLLQCHGSAGLPSFPHQPSKVTEKGTGSLSVDRIRF